MHKVHKSASGRKQRAARHDNNQSMIAQKKNLTMDLGFFNGLQSFTFQPEGIVGLSRIKINMEEDDYLKTLRDNEDFKR